MRELRFPGGGFPFGTHVFREPHQDQDELLADLPVLKRAGFNMIKVQECWSVDEPREGEIDLSRIERVIARAGELGLGVYVGLTMEQAPAWLWRKHPDCRMVQADGRRINDPTQYCLPSDGKPGPCWDNPGARAAGEAFVGELARRLGRFENIWAWNTFQEIGFWAGGTLGLCYCPHTLAAWRQWLGEKFGSLAGLNCAWQTGFGDWDEVEPPRLSPACAIYVDWRDFMDNVYVVRALGWKSRALRENDPHRRPVFSHVATPGFAAGCTWRWARAGDFFGNSNYPQWWCWQGWDDASDRRDDPHVHRLQETWDGVMFRTDLIRSAAGRSRPIWGAEFQGGPICTHLNRGRDPAPEDIRRWVLSGMAAGMNGISFWNHRSEITWSECNGFGLLDARGDSTPRFEEAGRIARAIHRDPGLFSLGSTPPAQVAILVNDHNRIFCQATGDGAAAHLDYGTRGWYFRLWRMGIPVDFVEAEDVDAGMLADYKAAILPVPLALDAGYFGKLRRYVEQGGMLVSDGCPGRFDKYGYCPRSQMVAGAEELFGAVHRDVRLVREPSGARSRWALAERGFGAQLPPTVLDGAGPLSGTRIRASFYVQTLEPTGSEPVLTSAGAVCGVRSAVGAGQAVLVGTFAGHSATAHTLDGESVFFEKLLSLARVQPDACGRLLRRRRVLGDRQAWFLINPCEEAVTETVGLEGFASAVDLLGEPMAPAGAGAVRISVPAGEIRCLVLA